MRVRGRVALAAGLCVVLAGLLALAGLKRQEVHRFATEEAWTGRPTTLLNAVPAASEARDGMAPRPSAAGGVSAAGGPSAARTVALAEVSRKLVRTADLDIAVKATSAAADELRQVAGALGGYVGNLGASRAGGVLRYSLTLRVPTARFDDALAAVKKLAVRIDREQQSVEDATDRHIDLDARLKSLRGTEDELRALLAESRRRESSVEDIMKVHEKLTEIRSQVEEVEGKLVAIDKLVALSTLNVTLSPTEAARPVSPEGWNPGDILRSSVRSLVAILHAVTDLAIWLVVVALPVVALLFAVALAGRSLLRRFRRARTEASGT
jgi:hypothetical protein